MATFEEIKGALEHLHSARRLSEGADLPPDLSGDAKSGLSLLSAGSRGPKAGIYKCTACGTESTCDASGACEICGEQVASRGEGGRHATGSRVERQGHSASSKLDGNAGSKLDGQLGVLKHEILDLIARMLPEMRCADKPGQMEGRGEREGAGQC